MLKLYRGIISSEDKRGVNGNGASTGDGKEILRGGSLAFPAGNLYFYVSSQLNAGSL